MLQKKGGKYANEQDHSRGTGGYSFYNPSWTTRTWDDRAKTFLNEKKNKVVDKTRKSRKRK